MINYNLPTYVIIDNKKYNINKKGDYRVILDIIQIANDDSIPQREKPYAQLCVFYGYDKKSKKFIIPDNVQEALHEIQKFISLGDDVNEDKPQPKLMDWEQDFNLLVPPINDVLGYEVRTEDKYTHWWTFVGAYMEISGDCVFSHIKDIRLKRSRGEKLDKSEQKFFNENKDLILFKNNLSQEDREWLNSDD